MNQAVHIEPTMSIDTQVQTTKQRSRTTKHLCPVFIHIFKVLSTTRHPRSWKTFLSFKEFSSSRFLDREWELLIYPHFRELHQTVKRIQSTRPTKHPTCHRQCACSMLDRQPDWSVYSKCVLTDRVWGRTRLSLSELSLTRENASKIPLNACCIHYFAS